MSGQVEQGGRRSFSATGYRGNSVQGVIVAELFDTTMLLVEEDVTPKLRLLWIVDSLDDVGVSFSAEQLAEMLPQLQKWLTGQQLPHKERYGEERQD